MKLLKFIKWNLEVVQLGVSEKPLKVFQKKIIIGKLEKTDLLTNPGPGSYQPSIILNKAPNWK